jgi:hypothetical protein
VSKSNRNILQAPSSCVILVSITLVLYGVALISFNFAFLGRGQQLPIYDSSAIEKICQVLSIDSSDEFCISNSEQNARTFEAMLQRYFPIETSSYNDIMPLVEIRFTSPSYELLNELGTSAVGFCPTLEERDGAYYSCIILFSPPVRTLTIRFDSSTDRVVAYVAWRPSSS